MLLYKIRLRQPANTGDGLISILSNFIAEFQEAPLLLEIRMVCRRNCIFQTGMVRQSYMKTGDTGTNEHWHKNFQFRFDHTSVTIVGFLLSDCQFIINRKFRQSAANCTDRFYGKPSTIFCAAAVLIGAVIENG